MSVYTAALVTGVTVTGAIALSAQGAVGRIDGHVRDSLTGKPLTRVTVMVVGTAYHATTDSLGYYVLAALPTGTVAVRAAYPGYRAREMAEVKVIAGQRVVVDFSLAPSPTQLNDITVSAARNPLVGHDISTTKQVVTGDQVRFLPVDRVSQALALQPGVFGTNGFEEASITTGSASRSFGNAQAGNINISARGGRTDNAQGPSGSYPGTESYDRIVDNPFLGSRLNPLSTFSIDVDRASYSNVRRFITSTQRPARDAVRVEEMINYFPYDYPAPSANSEHPFTVTTEVAQAPWNPQHRIVRIGLQGRKIETANLPPSNFVFLLDVSGSMEPENRLPLIKKSLRLLVEQLRPQDRVALAVYAGNAGLVLPSTSGSAKAKIMDAIEGLSAGGSTAGGAGLRLAYKVARESFITGGNNRVILATDGDFNVGMSSDAEMERLIEDERQHGVFLTVLGVGFGNLKDSKLEKLADKGNGTYAYIDGLLEARKVLVQEMGGTLVTIAKDVKLQVEFNPAKVQAYRLIGYENRMLRTEDFADDRKDAGDMGAGHAVTALYEVIPAGARRDAATVDTLRYQTPARLTGAAIGDELLFVKIRYKDPGAQVSKLLTHTVVDASTDVSADFTFATAVAEFGLLLRESEYRGNATVADVLALAKRSLGRDAFGYRSGFVELVEAYQKLPTAVGVRE